MTNVIYKLYEIIKDREKNPVEGSYTNRLLTTGYERTAQKLGEEAVEVIIAACVQGRTRLIEEASDLIYHLFVLLVQQSISLEEIDQELNQRHAQKEGQ
jgi:phosphoribosyl-ATP pyrophosphohydrolase